MRGVAEFCVIKMRHKKELKKRNWSYCFPKHDYTDENWTFLCKIRCDVSLAQIKIKFEKMHWLCRFIETDTIQYFIILVMPKLFISQQARFVSSIYRVAVGALWGAQNHEIHSKMIIKKCKTASLKLGLTDTHPVTLKHQTIVNDPSYYMLRFYSILEVL